MPRIPRAEVSLETRIADQPFSSGDGYAAPGRAMQQLGQGIASFGAGLEAWNAKEDEQNAFKDDLTLLKASNQADRDLIAYRETYRGDGTDYDQGAHEIIQRNLNVGDQMVSKRGRERFALNYERLSGARREQAMRQGSSLREKALYEDTATAISGQMQQLLGDADKDPEAFTQRFEGKLSEIEMIIDRMPIGAHRTALEKHAATLAKSMLEGRGLKELPIANELIKKWSVGAERGAALTPSIGGVSAKYESGGNGVAFISSGKGDPGGQSYGIHQLSTKDSMGAFLRSAEGQEYAGRFKGLSPGTPQFNEVYRQIAGQDGDKFAAAQHAFYSRTHYQPVLAHAKSLGFDVEDRGVQEALFSASVQHGGAKKIVSAAAGSAKGDAAAQINALYQARSRYVEGVNLPDDTKASVLKRYQSEVRDALKLAGQKGDAGSTVASGRRGTGGILTSLEDAPSVDEIEKERPAIVDMDLKARGAGKALMAAKRVGAKVAAYHEGGGGGASWGEGERDLKSDKELAKLAKDAKTLAGKGADYLHVDNMHNLDAAGIGKVAEAVRQATDGKMSIVAKNNTAAWVEAIKANPEIKPPYAIIEHGMKDPATIEAAKQLAEMGVPVHFVEFADPGKDKISGKPRTDPISTAEEARAFAKGNAWANVIHMPTQDRYDGRSVNGAQVFRGEQPSEGGGPTQVAQARTGMSDAGPSNTIGTRRGVRGHLTEMLIKDMDQMGKRHQKMQEHLASLQQVDRWLQGQEEFNKYNDNNRKLLDKSITDTGLAEKIMKGEPDALQFGIMASQVTNYTLKPVAEGLLGLVKSTDPLKRVRGYEAAGSILDRNPDAFDLGDDEKRLAQEARDYQTEMRFVDPGLPLVDQQKLAIAKIDERRSPEWKGKDEARKKVAEATAKGFTSSTIADLFDAIPILPFTNPGTVDGDLIALRYSDRYKEHFTRTGDDARAKVMAQDDLKREYGVTSVLGRKEVIKHPPERRYPLIFNPETKEADHSYIAKDIERSVSAWATEKITIDKITLRGDEQTDRDIRAGRPPSYAITFLRKDKSGTEHRVDIPAVVSPGGAGLRWSMGEKDIGLMQVQAAKTFGEMRAKQALDKSKSVGDKVKEIFGPLPEWKDRPPTKEQKILKDFIEKLKRMGGGEAKSIGGEVVAP